MIRALFEYVLMRIVTYISCTLTSVVVGVEGKHREQLVSYLELLRAPELVKLLHKLSMKTLPTGFQIQFDSQDEPDSRAITGIANFFDYGAMLGGVLAGFLSDQTRGKFPMSTILVVIFLF